MNIKLGIMLSFFACLFCGTFVKAQPVSFAENANLDSLRSSLIKLPWTEKEVTDISNIFSGRFYLRDKATETTFKEIAPDANIIHLATHAIIDDEQPLYSKFVFTKEEGSNDDGFLNTYELYNMQLNANLAVLSACNTGSGKLSRGEGIMSLARGFMYSGCPSVITSLWSVDDKSTAVIMKHFYEGLAKGLSKDEALRASKLSYLKNADEIKSNPFYWAGFILIGNPDAIYLKQGEPESSK